VHPSLRIISFGRFSEDNEYPIDYIAHRNYFSIDHLEDKCWYEASSYLADDGVPGYRVRPVDDPSHVFESNTPSGAWSELLIALQQARARQGLPPRKSTTVSGPWMYGWTMPPVAEVLDLLRK
jgi:hypothetical protein